MIVQLVVDLNKVEKNLTIIEEAIDQKKWTEEVTNAWLYVPNIIIALALQKDDPKEAFKGVGQFCSMWETSTKFIPQEEFDKIGDIIFKAKSDENSPDNKLAVVFFDILIMGPEEGARYFIFLWNKHRTGMKKIIENESSPINPLQGFGRKRTLRDDH